MSWSASIDEHASSSIGADQDIQYCRLADLSRSQQSRNCHPFRLNSSRVVSIAFVVPTPEALLVLLPIAYCYIKKMRERCL